MLLHVCLFFSISDQALTGKGLEDLLHPVTFTESVPGLVCSLAENLKPSQVSIEHFKYQYNISIRFNSELRILAKFQTLEK